MALYLKIGNKGWKDGKIAYENSINQDYINQTSPTPPIFL